MRPMSITAAYTADFGLIIALYGFKALLFRFVRSPSTFARRLFSRNRFGRASDLAHIA